MVHCFAFEIGQENHPKENGKASGLPLTQGEFCGLKRVHFLCAYVGHIHRCHHHPLLSTSVMNSHYFSDMLDYGSKNTRNN